ENTGSVVDGKVNVDTDGDGIGHVCDGFCEVIVSLKGVYWEGAEEKDNAQEVKSIIHIKAEESEVFQEMQLNQKLRDNQKCMKKDFKDVSGSYVQKSNKDLKSSSAVYYRNIGAEEKDTAQEVQSIIHIKGEESEVFQEMQLIQKLRDDKKCMKKDFKDVSGSYVQKSNKDLESSSTVYYRNIVTNSHVTPS
ncbi:hypothetical protein Tco_0497286, partial [Tanacetum coccineum]